MTNPQDIRMLCTVYGAEKREDGTYHIWQYSAGVSLDKYWKEFGATVIDSWLDLSRYEAHWIVRPPQKMLDALEVA